MSRRHPKVILCFILALGFLLVLPGCGSEHAITVQFLDKSSLERVKFLDLALFKDTVECRELNHKNYRSSEKKISDARINNSARGVDIIPVLLNDGSKGTDASGATQLTAWIDRLGGAELQSAGDKGLTVRMFILALGVTADGNGKENIAQGCASVNLRYQKTVNATIILTKIE